jgi:adenosylhomocysteine nucleosidase
MSTIAIIAALERELLPLVRGWKQSAFTFGGKSFRVYQDDHSREKLVAVAGGIGCCAAELAARAVVAEYRPQALISAGLAGAIIRSLKVGCVITPNVIIDGRSGTEYRCSLGEGVVGGGVLVSAGEIAGAGSKPALMEAFHALAVDMEAAGVAEVATEAQIGFCCVKAISDEADFPMPALNRFVGPEGNFQTGKFVAWAAFRPWVWPRVIALGRNGNRATRALCDWLKSHVTSNLQPGRVVRLERAEFSGESAGL